MAAPFIVPPKNRNVAGDFHRPYGTQKFLHSTNHRGKVLPKNLDKGGGKG